MHLKKPRRSGVDPLVFSPLAFLLRALALVPPAFQHQLRYFGALAPHAKLRPHVVPYRPNPPPKWPNRTLDRPPAPARPGRLRWADALARGIDVDGLACPCAARFQLRAVVQSPTAIETILAAIHLSNDERTRAPARAPP